jgi:hypothetical protein
VVFFFNVFFLSTFQKKKPRINMEIEVYILCPSQHCCRLAKLWTKYDFGQSWGNFKLFLKVSSVPEDNFYQFMKLIWAQKKKQKYLRSTKIFSFLTLFFVAFVSTLPLIFWLYFVLKFWIIFEGSHRVGFFWPDCRFGSVRFSSVQVWLEILGPGEFFYYKKKVKLGHLEPYWELPDMTKKFQLFFWCEKCLKIIIAFLFLKNLTQN